MGREVGRRLVLRIGSMVVIVALLASLEWYLLRSLGIAPAPSRWTTGTGIHGFSLSSQGRWAVSRLAYSPVDLSSSARHELLLHDLRNPRHVTRVGWRNLALRQAAIGSAGDRVALTADTGLFLCIAPWTSAPLQRLGDLADADATLLTWAPDDRWLAVATADRVEIRNAAGELHRRHCHDLGTPMLLRFSGDGRQLLMAGRQAAYCLWNVASGRRLRSERRDIYPATVTAFSGDLRTRAFTAADGALCVDTAADGASSVDTAADGASSVDTAAGVMRLPCQSDPLYLPVRRLALSDDGRYLAVADNLRSDGPAVSLLRTITVWDLQHREVVLSIVGSDRDTEHLSFDRQGTLYVCDGRRIRSWSIEEGREVWRLDGEQWMRQGGDVGGTRRRTGRR